MNITSYTQKDLRELSKQAFKSVADKYLRGYVVGGDQWFIRISASSTCLVTPYLVKQDDGSWIAREHTYTL